MNLKTAIRHTVFFCVGCLFLSACASPGHESATSHVDIALRYDGKYGNFPEKQKFLGSVGLRGNYDYCAAFVSYSMTQAEITSGVRINPSIRSGRVVDFIDRQAIPVNQIMRGSNQVSRGDILIWTYSETAGHTGISIEDWVSVSGYTIEGNTSHPEYKNLRGVFIKQRDISPGSYFRPRFVRKVFYE